MLNVFRDNVPIEFLDEDAHLFENHTVLGFDNENSNENDAIRDWSPLEGFTETIEPAYHRTTNKTSGSVCTKCVQFKIEVLKSQITISKLQKRCSEKTSEIKRLRLSQKRAQMAKASLEELLKEIKEKKWISDEGRDVLNVNE